MAEARAHYDRAIALYDPTDHRRLATRFGQDVRVAILSFRSLALWLLGYPEAALADAEHAIKDAHEIGHPVSLMYALCAAPSTLVYCGNYRASKARVDEAVELADERATSFVRGNATVAPRRRTMNLRRPTVHP